jgi:hypothetical protein
MNIRKKLAVAAAIALPVSGLAVLGGTELSAAGGPPILTCSSLGSDPTPGVANTGGVTFDNGSGPGTAGLSLGAGLSTTGVTSLDEDALAVGNNTAVIPNEVIAGQTITLGDSQTVTVVADATNKVGVASSKNFETVVFTPTVTTAIAKKVALTINPTTNGAYSTFTNTTVSSSSANVTAATADFTGDVGQPISVTALDGVNGYDSVFSPISSPASPAIVSSFISAVSPDGKTATVSQFEQNWLGVVPPSTVNNTTPTTFADPTETINSQKTGAVVVTVGSTTQVTNGSVATDYDLALTGCASSLHADAGVIYPNNVTLTTPAGTGSIGVGSAIALESSVLPISGAHMNFPSGLPAGYTWGGGVNPSGYVAGGAGGYSTVNFTGSKNNLNLSTDTESFVAGSVTGPFSTPKASMSFGLGSVVLCTAAQVQAIGTGSGGSGIDHGSIPAATSASDVGPKALTYCDGGSLSAVSGSNAFGELAEVEAASTAQAAGSDGTGLASIYQAGGSNGITPVIL